MGRNRRLKAQVKRRGYEFSGYQNDQGVNFKLVANTPRSALFVAKEGSSTTEYHFDKETQKKTIRHLENPFV